MYLHPKPTFKAPYQLLLEFEFHSQSFLVAITTLILALLVIIINESLEIEAFLIQAMSTKNDENQDNAPIEWITDDDGICDKEVDPNHTYWVIYWTFKTKNGNQITGFGGTNSQEKAEWFLKDGTFKIKGEKLQPVDIDFKMNNIAKLWPAEQYKNVFKGAAWIKEGESYDSVSTNGVFCFTISSLQY